MINYLKLPLRFENFFQRKPMDTCSLKDSIARNLHLLITTALGENKQDDKYGSQFWDHDYDIHMSNNARRETIINTLKNQILEYEKRLVNVVVEVNVKQSEFAAKSGSQLRRRTEITITGLLVRSNEPFAFQTAFFIAPLSFD